MGKNTKRLRSGISKTVGRFDRDEYGFRKRTRVTWTELADESEHRQVSVAKTMLRAEQDSGNAVSEHDFDALATGDGDNSTAQGTGFEGEDEDWEDIDGDKEGRQRAKRTTNFRYSWSDRLDASNAAWAAEMDDLTNALLRWEKEGAPECTEQLPLDSAAYKTTKVVVMFIKGQESRLFTQASEKSTPVIIVENGFIPTTPNRVLTALHVEVLELFAALNAQCPSLSAMAFVQSMCALQRRPYQRSMLKPFSDAYDVFMEIKWRIEKAVDAAVFPTTADAQRAACPSCMYRLCDEPPLAPAMLVAMDGNESLKRVLRTREDDTGDTRSIEVADSRRREAPFFLEKEYVNEFQHEVRARRKKATQSTAVANQSTVVANQTTPQNTVTDEGASPVDGLEEDSPCADNWVNLGGDHRKVRWGIFEETGIFVTVCRHGVVLLCCDMIRSGELAKYPLAHVAALTATSDGSEIGPFGKSIMIGYDIGCGFQATARASERLRDSVKTLDISFCVNAFHGHAHNRMCQLRWHSLYQKGVGIEDFKTCERLFSDSNRLARSTRNMSTFHRRQAIVQYFGRWNRDRLLSVSSFLHDNSKQAARAIALGEDALQRALAAESSDQRLDFERLHQEELAYFIKKRKPEPADFRPINYVKAIEKLRTATRVYNEAHGRAVPAAGSGTYEDDQRATRHAEKKRAHSREEYWASLKQVHDLENELDINGESERWSESREEWQLAKASAAIDDYRKALDKLEGLVISRYMELSRLNFAGVGYKARRHIVAVVKRRNGAIDTAVKQYNEAARRLPNRKPPITVEDALEYGTIGQFDLLRVTEPEATARPWTEPSVRATAAAYFKAERAREEVQRVEVEARRLLAFYRDYEWALEHAARVKRDEGSALAFQLERRLRQVVEQHAIHRARISRFAVITDDGARAVWPLALDQGLNPAQSPGATLGGTMGGTAGEDDHKGGDEELANRHLEELYNTFDDHVP